MSLSAEDFEALLDAAEHSAVHLEMRDSYASSEETAAIDRWRRTGAVNLDPESAFWVDWTKLVRRTVARGVVMRRARIVSEPVTEYIRFEHAGTSVNLALGEDVRWLPRRRASDVALPGNDFWLIDGRVIQWNFFTGDGELAGHERTDDPRAARLCAEAFEAVWERGTPHHEFSV
jgi:hypothetical protein